MDKLAELSKNEWLVMKICWRRGKATARDIFEQAIKKKKWEYQTVKTMLDRLAGKGYLEREKLGPIYLYQPSLPRSQVVAGAIESFMETVLDNTVAPVLQYFVKGQKLSEQEIASLKKLIDEYEDDNAGV